MSSLVSEPIMNSTSSTRTLDCRVASFTNIISPYTHPVYVGIGKRVAQMTMLVATPMESDRQWEADFRGLDVRVQRTLAIPERVQAESFSQKRVVHFPWDTLWQLRELRPDVILTRACGFQTICSAIYCAMHPSTALVIWHSCSEHTERNIRMSRRYVRRWLAKQADCMLANGDSCTRYLRSLGFPRERIYHGPYVALPETFESVSPQRHGEDAHRLICIGQLIERKGVVPLFNVLQKWGERNPGRKVNLVMVGSGPLESKLRSISMPANVQIEWTGYRTYDQIAAEYARCGLMIFPTYEDEWGLVVNEALAAGLPVIGSRYSQAVVQHCREGETGWTFHTEQESEFLVALDKALNTSESRLNEMRLNCRDEVRHVTSDYVVDNVIESLDVALVRRKQR